MKNGTLIVSWLVFACAGCSGAITTEFPEPAADQGTSGTPGSSVAPPSGALGNDSGAKTAEGTGAPGTLTAIIRDFRRYDRNDPSTNADFENPPITDAKGNPTTAYFGPWDDRGIVDAALGADQKPVYKNRSGGTLTTHGSAQFDQWFRDVAKTNVRVELPLVLSKTADGAYEFDSDKTPSHMFFPIDDDGSARTPLGNQGDPHNFSFTMELDTTFVYRGGEFFRFRGDDDVFVYIDGKLVIDLGGVHGPETASVNVDDLHLTKGQTYRLDFFSAERHMTGSNILFTTTLALEPAPPVR